MIETNKRIDKLIDTVTETRVELTKSLGKVHAEIASLKVKASVWGLFGGLIPVLIGLGALLLRG